MDRRLALIPFLLAACAPLPQKDGAPKTPFDPSRIEPAVPRAEPLSRYGNPPVYEVRGKRYRTLASARGYREEGIASWYGTKFHGRRTSSGEPYDMYAMTAAHKTLPLPSYVRVTAAAVVLGIAERGTARVRVEALELPEADDAPPPSGPFYLQAGAFRERRNAEALHQRLQGELDVPVRIETPRRGLYRVRIGPLADLGRARTVSEALDRLGVPAPLLIHD